MPVVTTIDNETLQKHSKWFLIYGIALTLAGVAAIILPGIASLATAIMLGWLLLFGGVMGLFAVYQTGRAAPGFWWELLTAVLYVLAGISLLISPVAGVLTLTILLAAYLFAAGVMKMILAFGYRRDIPQAWGWVLFSALLDLGLGLLIFLGLPGSAVWVLGLMVGINLVMTGVALIVAATCTKKMCNSGSASA
jgi:uncharacterized membrane protein HdeD (DUF308 family)